MSSFEWMANKGAPLLPKVAPFAIPDKMMELKRRPTIHDIRGSAYQLRHRHAPPDQQVPWNRVFFWPFKAVHVMTDQERNPLPKKRRKRVSQKVPKVVKAPPTPAPEKKIAAKFPVQYDYKRVLQYVKNIVLGAQVDEGAVEAASADGSDVVPTTTDAEPLTSTPIACPPTLPGAVLDDDDDAAADVDAQAQSAADDQAQPSLLATVFNFGLDLLFGPREPKRAYDGESEAGDAKRRRVGLDAQAPSHAEARPIAGKPARNDTTGATARTHHNSTATGARRRARNAPRASLELCPPPAPVEGNAKVVKARSMMPPPRVPARPIAGRPTRKRADTPDPRAPTPPPPSVEQASSAESSPSSSRSSSPSSSRSPSPAPSRSPSPSPAPKRSSSKAKSKSSDKSSSQRASAAFVSRELGPGEFLVPPYIEWSRDEFVNPWDPRAPAAPDPVYPWAPANSMWANARPAPIAPLPSVRTPSFHRPVSLRELGRLRADPTSAASTSSTAGRSAAAPSRASAPTSSSAASTSRHDRSPSPAREDFSGEETEVESGNEDSDNED